MKTTPFKPDLDLQGKDELLAELFGENNKLRADLAAERERMRSEREAMAKICSDIDKKRDAALAALRKARPIVEDVLKVTGNLEWWEEAHIALVQIDAVLGGGDE